jgi:hypothetical protein
VQRQQPRGEGADPDHGCKHQAVCDVKGKEREEEEEEEGG